MEFFGLYLPTENVFVLRVGPVIALGLWLLLNRTRAGHLIRAAVSYPEMLGALGVNVSWVMTSPFMLGCWSAGLGGVLVVMLANIDLGTGMEKIIELFAVVVVDPMFGQIGLPMLCTD